jgi:site-specific DNA-cytosine methylase
MRLLELFCGTKSVSRHTQFTEVISLDILPKFNPDIVQDILEWDYTSYPPGYFDAIWASPPCTQYSVAKTRGVRDIEGANKIVQKALEIIQYFTPPVWYLENPQTGLLKAQPFMAHLPYYDVDYCQYGKEYKKRTRIWTNKLNFEAKQCPGKHQCDKMQGGRHILNTGNFSQSRKMSVEEKYAIPDQLIRDLFA